MVEESYNVNWLTLSSLQTNTDTFANIVDPDETTCHEPSHQDLQFAILSLIFD